MSEHTKGPWSLVIGEHGDRHSRTVVCASPFRKIARINIEGSLRPLPSDEANARLIAAAPDMLSALIEAEACMSIVEPRSDKAEYLRILDVVRAAIGRARGVSSDK